MFLQYSRRLLTGNYLIFTASRGESDVSLVICHHVTVWPKASGAFPPPLTFWYNYWVKDSDFESERNTIRLWDVQVHHWSCRGEECDQSFHKWHNLVPSKFGLSINSIHKGNGDLLLKRESFFSSHPKTRRQMKLASDSEVQGKVKLNLNDVISCKIFSFPVQKGDFTDFSLSLRQNTRSFWAGPHKSATGSALVSLVQVW